MVNEWIPKNGCVCAKCVAARAQPANEVERLRALLVRARKDTWDAGLGRDIDEALREGKQ
jgi:hypothetical protein